MIATMKQIATISSNNFGVGTSNLDRSDYTRREAVRAILFDGSKVALVNVTKNRYYKLPGGGIERDENKEVALAREVAEEIGCQITIRAELGQITEHRDADQFTQVSYAYLATASGGTGARAFTDEEVTRGSEVFWASTLDEAIRLVEAAKPSDEVGLIIQKRDLVLLKAASSHE
jgi:8-oxo-dGTP diphosphatase